MPIERIDENDRRISYVASGGQTLFPFDFPVYAASDLQVTRSRGGAAATLALGTDYSAAGVNETAGGSITLTAPALAGDGIIITGRQPIQRAQVFTNGGPFNALSAEAELNRIVINLQQLRSATDRALRIVDTDGAIAAIPDRATRALGTLAFDANGDPVVTAVGLGGVPVSPFIQTLLDDASAFAARTTLQAVGRSGDGLTGPYTITNGGNHLTLNRVNPSGERSTIRGSMQNLLRWEMWLGNEIAESGANAGSNFSLARFDDAGNYLDIPFQITRATGVCAFTFRPTFLGSPLARIVDALSPPPNLLVNPSFRIDQERAGSNLDLTAGNAYACDQWLAWLSAAPGGTLRTARTAIATPGGSSHRLRCTVQAADTTIAAGDFYMIEQAVEGLAVAAAQFGTPSARPLLLRFGVRSSIAGTFGVSLCNAASGRSWVGTITIAAGEVNTDVVRELAIPGDTTGAWLAGTGIGVRLRITLAAGSGFQGAAGWQAGNIMTTAAQTNWMANASATFDLFDAGLHIDALGLGVMPQWQLPDAADELRACQRFYEKSYEPATAPGTANAPNAIWVHTWDNGNFLQTVVFNAPKRAIPAVSVLSPVTGSAAYRDYSANLDRGFSVADNGTARCVVTTSVVPGAVHAAGFHIVANARF